MSATSFSLTAGNTSSPFLVSQGERVTTTGTGKIQYTLSGIIDIQNNLATWIDWPNGTTAGFDDCLIALYCRAVASSGTMTVTVGASDSAIDGTITKDGAYWVGQYLTSTQAAALSTLPGYLVGSVQPRSGTLASLLALAGLPGEQSYATDYNFVVHHNGVAGEAVAEYRRQFGDLSPLDQVTITQNINDAVDISSLPYSPCFKIAGTLGGSNQSLSLPDAYTPPYGRSVRGGVLCCVINSTAQILSKDGDAAPSATIAAGKSQLFMYLYGIADLGWCAVGSNFTSA